MELGLKGKKALVLGASSGLGYTIAKALGQEGVRLAITSSNEDRIQKASKELQAIPLVADFDKAGNDLVQKAVNSLGGLDILIANTGGPTKGQFLDIDGAEWEKNFHRVFLSAVEAMQAAIPMMKKQKHGRIILLTSCAAKEPIANLTTSNALRAGLLGLMKSVSTEVAKDGITINSVLPGFVRTDALARLKLDEEKLLAQIPAARLGTVEEIANLFLFLASDAASYVTGQAIACDGGYLKSF